jgi:hypothetical protein
MPAQSEKIYTKNTKIWQIANGAGDTIPMAKGTEAAHVGTGVTIVPRNAPWKVKTI